MRLVHCTTLMPRHVLQGIPNKAITDCIVCNESSPRKAGSSALLSKVASFTSIQVLEIMIGEGA